MATRAVGTGTMRYVKYGIVLVMAYLFTLLMIIKCMPMYTGDTKITFADIRTNKSKTSDYRISELNMYALKRIKDTGVYFKRVIDDRKLLNEEFVETDDSAVDCEKTTASFKKIHAKVFSYSAYFDNRTGEPVIRLLAIIGRGFVKSNVEPFWCHFPMYDQYAATSYSSSKLVFYEMCENHKRTFGGWILTCAVPGDTGTIPDRVLIGHGGRDTEHISRSKSVCVTSQQKHVTRRKLKYGVCVPPVYGMMKPKSLIEFVEFHRIIGFDVFTMYVETSYPKHSDELESVLNYYEARNIMTVVRWQLPVKGKYLWYHGQSLAINDCLYRNMYSFQHLAFIDVDEFIVPHGNLTTMHDVTDDIQRTDKLMVKNACGFIFKSTIYSDEFSRKAEPEEMISNVQTNRTKTFSFFRNKAMVMPQRVFEMGIHHISRPWPDSANYSAINVDTSTAHVHHYRKCVREFGTHCESWVEDMTVPHKYGKTLVDNNLRTVYDLTP